MGYDLRQRLASTSDSWIAVDLGTGREVLAHRMGDPAASDMLPLVMQVLIGKNESARATVLDFVQQDGAWLLVTIDTPEHREIRQWLQGTGARQGAAAPAVDPVAMTRMFRGADPTPVQAADPSGGAYTQLFSPPGSPAPEAPRMGEFTRFFATAPTPNAGDRTKVYSAVESTPPLEQAPQLFATPRAADPPVDQPRAEEATQHFPTQPAEPAPTPSAGAFTQYFATGPEQPRAEEATQKFTAPPETPLAVQTAGAFTQYFATGPEQPRAEEATQKITAEPEPPLAVQTAGAFTQYFATGREQPRAEEATQKFAAEPEPPLAVQTAGAFTQYFAAGPEQPRAEEATQKFVAQPAAPPPVQSAGEFTQYFASGPEQARPAAVSHSPAQSGAGEFTRMFNSAKPAPARQVSDSPAGLTGMFGESASQPPPAAPSGEGATGFFESPSAKSAAPPAGVVASDFTRMLQAVPADAAPAAKAPASGKEKPAAKAFPIWILFAGVLLLAIALVAGVLLVK